jgi:DNA polymerase-3 subunit epsilon
VAARNLQHLKTRWPLDDMLGSDLMAAVQRRLQALRLRAGLLDVDEALWLKVDSYALMQALCHLAQRLHEDFGVQQVLLRLRAEGRRAQLDLVWPALPMSTETVMAWETEPMTSGSTHSPLSVRDVVERHDGAFWFERDRVHQQQFLRFLLPLADGHGDASAAAASAATNTTNERPEFYDFDLFRQTESTHALDDQPLASLRYTVFDTETTGLEPSAGDEIIQLGAVRVVNGRLLRQECIDQLVDPQRNIPEAGIPIHHITPDMVRGKPTITRVLPAFHAFAADTVLVAHNAAFDMRFLQLKEAATGLKFDQPVLDTLLLSAVVHRQQDSHRLEAMAERLGVQVVGRHTALGDALVTAEVFLKLLPLLAAMGITTLGQAREAAQKTYLARLRY